MSSPDQPAKNLLRQWYSLRTRLSVDGDISHDSHSRKVDSYCTITDVPVSSLILRLDDGGELLEIPISNTEDLELDAGVSTEPPDSWVTIRKPDNGLSLLLSTAPKNSVT